MNTRKRVHPDIKNCRTCRLDLPVGNFQLAHRSCLGCEALRAQGLKRCRGCGEAKVLEAFHQRPHRFDGRESCCRACKSERSRIKNSDPLKKRRNREVKLRAKYGIGVEDVETMLAEQGGRCAICRRSEGAERFHVDHDHETGAVRSLLCLQCNALLGHCREDPSVLHAAVEYLERHTHEAHLGS